MFSDLVVRTLLGIPEAAIPAAAEGTSEVAQVSPMQECFRLALPLVVALTFGVAAPATRADVWGYVDADGTAHVATERVDERYANRIPPYPETQE